MNSKETQNASSEVKYPPYGLRLVLAFLVCFVFMLIFHCLVDKIRISGEVWFFVGFVPVVTSIAILYPTGLARGVYPALRMAFLFLISYVIMTCAHILLL